MSAAADSQLAVSKETGPQSYYRKGRESLPRTQGQREACLPKA